MAYSGRLHRFTSSFGQARPFAATPLADQRAPMLQAAALAVLPSVLLVAALASVTGWKGIPFGVVASDPITVGDLPFYAGLLSNVGVLLWAAAAAVALFTGAMLRRGDMAAFLLTSGVFTTVLLVDDFFLIHEIVFPYYLGLPQKLLIAAYGLGALAWLAIFARTIARTDYVVLLIALCALGVSVVIDQLPPVLPLHLVWEDGAKLVGIAVWCVYFVRTSARALRAGPLAQ